MMLCHFINSKLPARPRNSASQSQTRQVHLLKRDPLFSMTAIGKYIDCVAKRDTLNKMINLITLLQLISTSTYNEVVYVDVCAVV